MNKLKYLNVRLILPNYNLSRKCINDCKFVNIHQLYLDENYKTKFKSFKSMFYE